MSNRNATGRKLVKTRYVGVYQRGNGYAVRFVGPDGRTCQRSARTLAEARALRSELTADVRRGEYRLDVKVTFAAYAAKWVEGYHGRTSRGIRAETIAEYRRDLRPAVARLGRMRLTEIAAPDLRGYIDAMAEEGLMPATIRRRVTPVRALLATAVEDGLIRSNPAAGLRVATPASAHDPDDYEDEVKALTVEELDRLIAEVPEGWRRAMVELIAQSGLRIGEALGARWADLDLGERRLRVRQRVREGRIGPPKSERGRRAVPVSVTMVKTLAALRLASPWSRDTDLIFAGQTGKPRHARGCYPWFKTGAERAGVGWAAFHTLRHTAATRWLATGVSLPVVSRLLGHSDPAFTLRVYAGHVRGVDLPDGDALAAAVGR